MRRGEGDIEGVGGGVEVGAFESWKGRSHNTEAEEEEEEGTYAGGSWASRSGEQPLWRGYDLVTSGVTLYIYSTHHRSIKG